MEADTRKIYMENIIKCIFDSADVKTVLSDVAFETFLDDVSCSLLCVIQNKESLSCLHKLTNADKQLVFLKHQPVILTGNNLSSNVSIQTILGSTVSNLHQTLNQIYFPTIFQNEEVPYLQQGLALLQSGLKYSNSNDHIVTKISDEVKYWQEFSEVSSSKRDKERAQTFLRVLEPLESELSGLSGVAVLDLEELIDIMTSSLDELWRLEMASDYPMKRMEKLLDVLGSNIVFYIQRLLATLDLWTDDFTVVLDLVQMGINTCEKWPKALNQLLEIFWGPSSERHWSGSKSHGSLELFNGLLKRLEDIKFVRSVYRQLTRLLSASEQRELQTGELFMYFKGVRPEVWSPFTAEKWKSCLQQFEKGLLPIEQRVATKLRSQIRHLSSNTLQLLQELKRYEELLKRPSISAELTVERENFLGLLLDYVKNIDINRDDVKKPNLDIPDVVSYIYWAHQLKSKVKDILDINENILNNLKNSQRLKELAENALTEISTYENDEFQNWVREIHQGIKSGNLTLSSESKVLEIKEGRMVAVNYSPRLGLLVTEVQQLSALGFTIPEKITSLFYRAVGVIKQARALEQIAHFHNTIGDRMIASQKPMMLSSAKDLENLILTQNGVTWEEKNKLDIYIGKLQDVVEVLARQNNKLTFWHEQIRSKVIILMDTDIVRQQAAWKTGLREIREIILQAEEQKFVNMRGWKMHWDVQLYKALERQYQLSLTNLHSNLPEIKVELVYRQQKLQFNPSIEEIKHKYYGQVKRFLNLPKSFRGVSESSSDLFAVMIDRNAHRFGRVFAEADILFEKLEIVRKNWLKWVSLGTFSLEECSGQVLKKADDWDLNFRASKNFGQEIAKLPYADEKVGCVVVSLVPIRTEIELQNRRYWDSLVISLQSSVLLACRDVDNFIQESTRILNTTPKSLDQVANAYSNHSKIIRDSNEMLKTLEEAIKKNKMLASWTKEKIELLNQIAINWEGFLSNVENFELLIGQQVEQMKTTVQCEAENLMSEAEKFRLRWEQLRPKDEDIQDFSPEKLTKALAIIKEKNEEWKVLQESREKLVNDFNQFNMECPDFQMLLSIENELEECNKTWSQYESFTKDLDELSKEEWIIFRSKMFSFEQFLSDWEGKVTDSNSSISVRILREIQDLKNLQPLLKLVRGDAFSDRHWMELCQLLSMPNKPPEALIFGDFLKVRDQIIQSQESLHELNSRAISEVSVRQALAELDTWEVQARFPIIDHVDCQSKSIHLLKDFDEIINKLADNQCLVQNVLRSCKNKSGFLDRAEAWERKLALLEEVVKNLNGVQRKWVYLEPIFGNGTFAMESSRFQRVDQDFRHLMLQIEKDNHVVALARMPNLKQNLSTMLQQLSKCQSSLDQYLQEKRFSFPRFYFLADDDLLELLGQSSKEYVIQAHLKKIFAGIHSVIIDDGFVTTICSVQGEQVLLNKKISTEGPVESWLNDLNREMKRTLEMLLVSCTQDTDPMKYPAQILCLAEQIWFTKKCEEAISNRKLHQILQVLKDKLNLYSSSVMGITESNVLSLKLKSLLMDTVFHITIVETLIQENVTSIADWQWQKQLRFYMEEEKAVAHMVDAEMTYTYEYQGIAPKLVRTPLTERCFLTLTQAIKCSLGGNPLGPAGTGKTESVKALGGLLGRQVLVFNCDEGIDVESMGRIFVGIVKCGAWGCFDEFNRLDESTLSTVSMLIQPIQGALKDGKSTVKLLQDEVEIDRSCGLFVTLNPAGKGYGGRQKLPDNLKKLFRPVIMSAPDQQLIAQVSLFCDGYKEAKSISRKLVELFDYCGQVLSRQQHYDWGLRALKTILGSCGSLLRDFREKSREISSEEEFQLVVQAVRFNTLSKLTFTDCEAFDALVRDVFLNVIFTDSGLVGLTEALNTSCEDLGLQISSTQIKKCLEVYEQMQQRMGVAIVGPPRVGKTSIIKILRQALLKMGHTVECYTINPKSMSRTELLGYVHIDTRQWNEGVLTHAASKLANLPTESKAWLICDGDVDPEWIESLNSVLDDNRLLTLPSGWRIQFGPNVNFIFETDVLTHASPATVSRLGTIFLSEETFDANLVIKSWLEHVKPNDILETYLYEYLPNCLEWISKNCRLVLSYSKNALIQSALSFMKDVSNQQEFLIALIRGMGANLNFDDRAKFANHVFNIFAEHIPDGCQILDCYYNADKHRIDFFHHEDLDMNNNIIDSEYFLMTKSAKRNVANLDTWLVNQEPVIICGSQGSGIGMLLKNCFSKLSMAETAEFYCSSLTTPHHILYKLRQLCTTGTGSNGRILRSKSGNALILCLKNLELATPDKYGTNILLAWLQQLISYNGFFDTDLEWTTLEHIQIVGITSGSGYQLPTRLTSVMRVLFFTPPDIEDLKMVNYLHLSWALKDCQLQTSKVTMLVDTVMQIYQKIAFKFSQVSKQHYCFTPRHVTLWCRAISRYPIESSADAIKSILAALFYEAHRIFGDRLTTKDEVEQLTEIINSSFTTDWGSAVSDIMKESYFISAGSDKLTNLTMKEWSQMITKTVMMSTNGENSCIITDELLHLARALDRCFHIAGRSVVLTGRPGVGRKLAAKTVASLHNFRLITLNITTGYGIKHFKNDLKAILTVAGIEGHPVAFLLEDCQITDSEFIQIFLNLITSGEVYGLFTTEEFESIIASVNEIAMQDGQSASHCFANRIKANLHVVFIFDFEDVAFPEYLTEIPNLYTKLDFVWIPSWSVKTMKEIPQSLLPSDCLNIADWFYTMIQDIDAKSATPRRFLSFVELFSKLYSQKHADFTKKIMGLENGVSKLTETRTLVDNLKKAAAKQEQELAEKQTKASKALDMISETMQNANTHKEEMEKLKQRTVDESIVLKRKKAEIEKELAEVEPLVEEAKQAVGNIRNESLSEIRSLRAPPDVIRDILEGVLRLMGIQDTSWNSMKTFLSKRGVKEEIRGFDAHKCPIDCRKAVEVILKERGGSFDQKVAKRASAAAAPLAEWVKANIAYARILEKIRPLEEEQSILQGTLKASEDRVGQLSTSLGEVDEKVAELKQQLNMYTREAAVIEINLNKERETVAAAEQLLHKLLDEHHRWKNQLQEVSEGLKNLMKNILLCAGFVTFLVSEPEDIRTAKLQSWQSLLNHTCSIVNFLSSEQERLRWFSQGLPNDPLTVENSVGIFYSHLTPLLLDPSSFAKNWLLNHFEGDVELISQDNPRFVTTLELAIRFGKTLLIEDVTKVHPVLRPILRHAVINQGGRRVISIADKLIDFHDNFRLFLISQNVDVEPCFDATVIDYTTTPDGFAGQLLAIAVDQEKPELGSHRSQLLKDQEEMSAKLFSLQEGLLKELGTAQGNILQNADLLKSLNETKSNSELITKKLEESNLIELRLDEECALYRKITHFAANTYFALAALASLNKLYRYSIYSFREIVLKSLIMGRGENLEELKRIFIKQLYYHISRSLFNADRLVFALLLIRHCYPSIGRNEEWQYLLGDLTVDKVQKINYKPSSFIDSDQELAVLRSSVPELYDKLDVQNPVWSEFANSSQFDDKLPVNNDLTPLQKVLAVKAFRGDRLHSALTAFACRTLGIDHLAPAHVKFQTILESSKIFEPILMIISPGVDPSEEVQQVAREMNVVVHEVSLGQGQVEHALTVIRESTKTGDWVCLKNLHLMTDWLIELEQETRTFKKAHERFRLWCTSEPHPRFPAVLAQNSLKITFEAPPGIKKNLLRTYTTWPTALFQKNGRKFAKVLFITAWFHALIQERRTFIPQGWTTFYEIADVDLQSAVDILQRIISPGENKAIPWEFIRGLFYQTVYSGRIHAPVDMEILAAYLNDYFNQKILDGRNFLSGLAQAENLSDYLKIINQLPETDDPKLFGIAKNIQRSWQRNECERVFNLIKGLRMSDVHVSKTEWQVALTPLLNLWKTKHQGLSLIGYKLKETKSDLMDQCVGKQFALGIKLINLIHKHLALITRVIKKTASPDYRLIEVALRLMKNQVPADWLKLWWGPDNPQQYLIHVIDKTATLQKLRFSDEPIDLSTFFYPEAFLKTLKQLTSRQEKISLDELELACDWKPINKMIPCRICNLLLQGALYENGRFVPCREMSPTVTSAPVFTISFKKKEGNFSDQSSIKFPCYKNEKRDELLMWLTVPCDGTQSDWLKTGAAFFCSQ